VRDDENRILLEKRPAQGVWGGLWSLPECAISEAPIGWVKARYGLSVEALGEHKPLRHRFTHFLLNMHPCETRIKGGALPVMEGETIWYNEGQTQKIGLAAPVARLIKQLNESR
jgi:A/G-specific adenine glycosylase